MLLQDNRLSADVINSLFRCWLSLHKLSEHFLRVDGDEDAFAAGQHLTFLVEDFGHVDVLTSVDSDFPALHGQWLFQRHGKQILDGHLLRHGNDIAQLVHFSHGVVENGGDNAAVAVAGRAGVTVGQIEVADESSSFAVQRELQVHAVGVVGTAGKAVVLRQLEIVSLVAVHLAGHWNDSSLENQDQMCPSPIYFSTQAG